MDGLTELNEHAVEVKSRADLEKMRRAGRLLREMRDEVASHAQAGVSTLELDERFARLAARSNVTPAFLGLYGFPGCICASINEEVVHGIPAAEKILKDGDIVSLDMGIILDGFYTDSAVTVAIGKVDEEKRRLLEASRRALEIGIEACRAGHRLGDVGAAIQACVEDAGFSVVREYTGHGIGRSPHESPKIPNFGTPGKGPRIREGWTLALEPMVNAGTWRTQTLSDEWTVVTADRRPSAHFEHTLAVTENGPEVLT